MGSISRYLGSASSVQRSTPYISVPCSSHWQEVAKLSEQKWPETKEDTSPQSVSNYSLLAGKQMKTEFLFVCILGIQTNVAKLI